MSPRLHDALCVVIVLAGFGAAIAAATSGSAAAIGALLACAWVLAAFGFWLLYDQIDPQIGGTLRAFAQLTFAALWPAAALLMAALLYLPQPKRAVLTSRQEEPHG